MLISGSNQTRISWFVFALGAVSALFFAIYTDHRWEDWYITFRASKNLSEGLGFTFNLNERVHSFTSPIGTLIPAFLNAIFHDDEAVIWSFRFINIGLVGLIVKLVFDFFSKTIKAPLWLALLVAFVLVFDEKSIDYSINGMETAFMLLGIVLLIRELFRSEVPDPLRLGLIFAYLMWSRPDAFIHIGSLLLSYLIFKGRSWKHINVFFRGGLIGILFYAPWILFAWWYYGSPVPNTILAKGFTLTLESILNRGVHYFQSIFMGLVSSEAPYLWIFAPAYYYFESWPVVLLFVLKVVTYASVFLWAIPKINSSARFLSFAAFLVASYLNIFSPTIYPWYIPAVMVICLTSIGCALAQPDRIMTASRNWIPAGVLSVILIAQIWVYAGGLVQMRSQQDLIENGLRKQIGLWLKDESKTPDETVFLEPLGYIGFYSGLTMYDYPGLCNKKVIEARKQLKTESYVQLINYLQPNWVVFRPWDLGHASKEEVKVFDDKYLLARTFSQKDIVKSLSVYGRNYLDYDSEFLVYKKK
ncbi:glycosyltransferase family 39 protein [Dyadobacter sp. CY326]|uniref:glycosyltransferase family 39 protein n=1 Tax=Dyadobacter sp. CY326 TaxID=2907300 RepID=UPI001F1C3B26|nr:glycosyltransferase family 39 protein [Dyadobacter sp. CY326]MCE7068358.1 glycosyltransferase family 39 protein [Dyadobacter sp. CY326]